MAIGQCIDVGSIASATLDAVVAHFAAAGGGLPERRIIVPGEVRTVAWDCEAVTVACGGIVWGQGPGAGAAARPTGNPVSVGARSTIIAVQIIRCSLESDGGIPPDADKLTDAGLLLMRDAGLLSQVLVELCGRDGALRRFGLAQAGAVEMLGPDGGLVAVEGNLQVTVKDLV